MTPEERAAETSSLNSTAREMDQENAWMHSLALLKQEEDKILEEDLLKNENWILASKVHWENMHETPYVGTDEDAARWGINAASNAHYGLFNADMPWSEENSKGLVAIATDIENWDPHQQVAFSYLFEAYHQKDPSWAGFGRALRALSQDPINAASVTGIPYIVGKFGGVEAAKAGFRYWLHARTKNIFSRNMAVAAGMDTAAYSSAHDAMLQNYNQDVSASTKRPHQDFDWKRNARVAGTGALLGAAMIAAPTVAFRAVKKTLNDLDFSDAGSIQLNMGVDPTPLIKNVAVAAKDFVTGAGFESLQDRYSQAIELIPFLNDAEIAMLDRKRMGKRFNAILERVRFWDKQAMAQEMANVALAGKAKLGWYRESGKLFAEIFGSDFPRFAALLSSFSPQQPVAENLRAALNIWMNWDAAGRPVDEKAIRKIFGQSVRGEKGEGSVLPGWAKNGVLSLTESMDKIILSGGKVDSFMRNLWGDLSEGTHDSWMARFFGVDPNKVGVSKSKTNPNDPGKNALYQSMNIVTRQAAEILANKTGIKWQTAEVQETVWSYINALVNKRRDGDTRPFDEIIRSGDMTDEVILATDDFATLIRQDEFRQILGDTEYGSRLDAAPQGSFGAADIESGIKKEISGGDFTPEPGSLEQFGRRIEREYNQFKSDTE